MSVGLLGRPETAQATSVKEQSQCTSVAYYAEYNATTRAFVERASLGQCSRPARWAIVARCECGHIGHGAVCTEHRDRTLEKQACCEACDHLCDVRLVTCRPL